MMVYLDEQNWTVLIYNNWEECNCCAHRPIDWTELNDLCPVLFVLRTLPILMIEVRIT